MQLGNFSTSLAVKDIYASKTFYETLGFKCSYDSTDQGWAIVRNGPCVIGLFQGMFEDNILTFNPGWDENGQTMKEFTDIRDIYRQLKASNIKILKELDENSSGPAHFIVEDPDGNKIMFDQHV